MKRAGKKMKLNGILPELETYKISFGDLLALKMVSSKTLLFCRRALKFNIIIYG